MNDPAQNDDVTIEPEDGEGSTKTLQQKLKDIKEKLSLVEKERVSYLEGWQRAKADYINLKKRAEEDRGTFTKYAGESLILELLPVLDSFEGALSHVDGVSDEVLSGLKNTYTQFLQVLASQGSKPFDPLRDPLDPTKHEPMDTLAVQDKSDDNTVTKVYQKGYTLHGKVIRPARVQVAHFTKP